VRSSTVLTFIRVGLGLIFAMYGLVKLAGGQYYYGDWVMDKKTVDGTSLVWAFFGYSQVYGRFTGLFELIPAILLIVPRTATIGAAALFAVSLNITVMDFSYGYPAVKYFALLYTVLLGVLLWVDRHKLLLLLEDNERARAVLAALPAPGPRAPMGRTARRLLFAAVALFVIFAANLIATSLSGLPTAAARQSVAVKSAPGDRIDFLRARQTGLIGLNWTATLDYTVARQRSIDTVTVRARKITGFLPWRIEGVGLPSR
jgi:uncharacterized membrane protein YphA (DoxX/SURF4 family)